MEIESIYFQALQGAVEASNRIMEIYLAGFEAEYKEDGSPITLADKASTEIIHKYLDPTEIPVTGEESVNSHFTERNNWIRCWCIDPLDGTKEFVSKNGEFAVNIALIENGAPIFGLIASPVNREIIIGSKEFGVFIIDFENIDIWTFSLDEEKMKPDPNAWHKCFRYTSETIKPQNLILEKTY